jgi:uncharacterized membrane protein YoaK (UPF0700 family)
MVYVVVLLVAAAMSVTYDSLPWLACLLSFVAGSYTAFAFVEYQDS